MVYHEESSIKITKAFIKKLLPKRSKYSNKIDGGIALIVGGGKGLYGAGILSALAATRSGAGYTHLMTDLKKMFPWLRYSDFILHPISLHELKKYTTAVIAIGSGLGMTSSKRALLRFLVINKTPKVIVDGDGLSILSKMVIGKLPKTWILTPHEGELARLLDTDSLEVKEHRLKYVCIAQKKFGCIIILKGAKTLIATGEEVYGVTSGTNALAKAGTGDVLSGMIAAFYAQKNDALDAALLGCFIHGHSSKLWLREKNDHLSMRPQDIIDKISSAIYQLRK
jgi:hydroxyethylthiazole kinase-like uncharacterized protein yjeF